ncbi:MAG: hypothetical protein HY644_12440 [Acidobacteria bacterium]|nr:hypothetical protein [Acidobacteriota bacterium]
MQSQRPARLLLIVMAGVSLLAALWAGLARLGWDVPLPSWSLPAYHGPLMVVGFLATLIGLERAVALKRFWAYGAAALPGLGTFVLVAGLPWRLGHGLIVTGSLFLIFVFTSFYRRQAEIFVVVMGTGALLLLVGHLLWQEGQPLYQSNVIPWWVGFLVLTIAGERLELSRFTGLLPRRRAVFLCATTIFLCGLVFSLWRFNLGMRVAGAGLAALAFWLLRHDIARRTVRHGGLARYVAISLLTGYLWLAAGGILWCLLTPRFLPGPEYDAMLHAIFLGFVFSMIVGHAPIIFPSILGITLSFRPAFYTHLCLLHLSLLVRVIGELAGYIPAQRWGGLANVAAILLFVANHAVATLRETSRDSAKARQHSRIGS